MQKTYLNALAVNTKHLICEESMKYVLFVNGRMMEMMMTVYTDIVHLIGCPFSKPYSRSCKWIHINTGMVIILDGYDDGDGKH